MNVELTNDEKEDSADNKETSQAFDINPNY
jgi:hypothetical protein